MGISKETLKNWLNGSTLRPYRWQPLLQVAHALRLSREEVDHLLQTAQQRPLLELARMASADDHRLLRPWLLPGVTPVDGDTVNHARQRLQELPSGHVPHPSSLPPRSRMPFPANPHFVGRAAEFKHIAAAMKGSAGNTVALSGMGGVGKTQAAAEFAHRYGTYFGGGVFWISCANAETIPQEIAACGDLYGTIHANTFQQLPLDEQVRIVLAAWNDDVPRLLIFDNCEDPALMQQWRPATGGCRVLITSRYQGWPAVLVTREVPLMGLARSESQHLLRTLSQNPSSPDTDLGAIAAALGDLPLALVVAGTYLHQYRHILSPPLYLQQLDQHPVLDHPSLQSETLLPTRHDANIARSLELSYRQLQTADPIDQLAVRVLARLAWFAPNTPIGRGLVQTLLGIPSTSIDAIMHLEDALRRIRVLGLITDMGTLIVHPLIHAFLRRDGTTDTDQTAAEQTLINLSLPILLTIHRQPELHTLHPHLKLFVDHGSTQTEQGLMIFYLVLAAYAAYRNQYGVALGYLDQAFAERKDDGQLNEHLHAMLWFYRGSILRRKATNSEATRAAYAMALSMNKLDGEENIRLHILILNGCGTAALGSGDSVQARHDFQACLTLAQQIQDQYFMAMAYTNLANTLDDPADADEVIRLYTHSLRLFQQLDDIRNCAAVLNNLGYMALFRNDHTAAERYLQDSLVLCERIGDADGIRVAHINCGRLAIKQGHFSVAASHYYEALVLTDDHPGFSAILLLEHMAQWYAAQQHWRKAQRMLHAAQHMRYGATMPRDEVEEAEYQEVVALVQRYTQGSEGQKDETLPTISELFPMIRTDLERAATPTSGSDTKRRR